MFKRRQFVCVSVLLATLPDRAHPKAYRPGSNDCFATAASSSAWLARKVHRLNERENSFAHSVCNAAIDSDSSINSTIDGLCQRAFGRPNNGIEKLGYDRLNSFFQRKRIEDHNRLSYRIENNHPITEAELALLKLTNLLSNDY